MKQFGTRNNLRDSVAQSLCLECGLCCNGTLFSYVPLAPDDLTPPAADQVVLEDGQIGLVQCCRFYRKKSCAIYQTGRPHSCIAFECNLMKRFKHNQITREQASKEIFKTLHQVEQVTAILQERSGIRARNLTALYQAWLNSIGGCHSTWSEQDEQVLKIYAALLSHLRQTFGMAQKDEHGKNAGE